MSNLQTGNRSDKLNENLKVTDDDEDDDDECDVTDTDWASVIETKLDEQTMMAANNKQVKRDIL